VDIYNTWDRVSHGYFYGQYYDHLYDVVYQMFQVFKKDVLLNPKYGSIAKKIDIIEISQRKPKRSKNKK
jgi:hypothetical protein